MKDGTQTNFRDKDRDEAMARGDKYCVSRRGETLGYCHTYNFAEFYKSVYGEGAKTFDLKTMSAVQKVRLGD